MISIFVRAPEIDISELESLFSAASASDKGGNKTGGRRGSNINKFEKVQLVSFRLCLLMFVSKMVYVKSRFSHLGNRTVRRKHIFCSSSGSIKWAF